MVANRPKLRKGLGAVDGGLVVAGGIEDVVVGAITEKNPSLLLGGRRGVVRAVGIDDVVLDQWVSSSAPDGKSAVAIIRVVISTVVDGSA